MKRLIALTMTAALIGGLVWYNSSGRPLSAAEVDRYMAQLALHADAHGGEHRLQALRSFLMEDDGAAFYTINLYRFYPAAHYADGSRELSGSAAYDEFASVMVRLLAARASHPVFGSDWVASNAAQWHRIVVVRYRSRRDMVDLFADRQFVEAATHKWAAIEHNERLVAQAKHIPDLVWPIAFLLACVLTWLATIRKRLRPAT